MDDPFLKTYENSKSDSAFIMYLYVETLCQQDPWNIKSELNNSL